MFDLDLARRYEDFFQKAHSESFKLLDGQRGVMISAPHSVEQTRDGKIKYAEPQTGVLAKLLHDELDCPVIFKTKNCGDDANYDENCLYKATLMEYIQRKNVFFLLDLHQLAPFREVKINIGTGKFKNIDDMKYINLVLESFTRRNIGIVQIDAPFDASYPYTVSSFISSRCHIPCVQIEMNSGILWTGSSECKLDVVFEAIKEIVLAIEKDK